MLNKLDKKMIKYQPKTKQELISVIKQEIKK